MGPAAPGRASAPAEAERLRDEGFVVHTLLMDGPANYMRGVRQLRRVFEHILQHRDQIWLTRPGDICTHIESLPAGTVPGA